MCWKQLVCITFSIPRGDSDLSRYKLEKPVLCVYFFRPLESTSIAASDMAAGMQTHSLHKILIAASCLP